MDQLNTLKQEVIDTLYAWWSLAYDEGWSNMLVTLEILIPALDPNPVSLWKLPTSG